MIGFNHVLSGALVAVVTPAEYLPYVPAIAFVLHFILDTFPHYGRDTTADVYSRKFRRILYIDAVLCVLFLLLACWLYPEKVFWIIVGTFFATLPDFLWIFRYYIKVSWKLATMFFQFAEKISRYEKPWGWSLEILYAMIMLTLLIGLS